MNTKLGTLDNPVKCDGVLGEVNYLTNLISIDRLPITYKRLGSVNSESGLILDKYAVYDASGGQLSEIYFNMYCDGYSENEIVEGFLNKNFIRNSDVIDDINFLMSKKRTIYGDEKFVFPESYVYIWSKSKLFLENGSYTFLLKTRFNMSAKDEQELKDIIVQVYYRLKGVNEENTIETKDHYFALKFLKVFDFELLSNENADKNVFKYNFSHKITKEKSFLYFRIT
jgi:hypothetical protein